MRIAEMGLRIGTGYDLHRLVAGRELILGGVRIPSPLGEDGHSDGDVLIHAVIDALLGACAEGDIGFHFPPGDPKYRGISSRVLLRQTLKILNRAGYRPYNVDSTVILEEPRLRPYIDEMRTKLAADLDLELELVSVKAKTNESIGPVGSGTAVEAHAVVMITSGSDQ